MRLAFLGTPVAAVASLRALVDAGHDVQMVVTRPDRRRARGNDLSASPVKAAAMELGLKVGYSLDELEGLELEWGVVVAYGAIIPASVLATVPMLNVHFSLLPRWRGAAPVERAILAGDRETGVCVMSLEPSLDTGPIHLVRRIEIDDKTSSQLTNELAELGARALVEVLGSSELLATAHPQVGDVTYAAKLVKETLHLVPTMTSEMVLRTVRLEKSFTFIDGRRLHVLRAHAVSDLVGAAGSLVEHSGTVCLVTLSGVVALDVVQPAGGRPMTARAWYKGAHLDVTTAQWA